MDVDNVKLFGRIHRRVRKLRRPGSNETLCNIRMEHPGRGQVKQFIGFKRSTLAGVK